MDLQMYLLRSERLGEEAHSKKRDVFFVEAFRRASRNIINHALNNGYTHVSIKWVSIITAEIVCLLLIEISRSSDWADEVDEQFPLPPTGQPPNLGGGPAIPSAPNTSEEFIWDAYSSNFGSVASFTYPLPRCII